MSSTFNLICMSHDPAIEIPEFEWSSRSEAEAAVKSIHELGGTHRECDLLLTRTSGGLVELGCLPGNRRGPYHPHGVNWVEASYARVFLAAFEASGDESLKVTLQAVERGCWSYDRLRRIRGMLNLGGVG